MSAAPELTIKRAEKNEKLVAMVPASLRAKQRKAAGVRKTSKSSKFGLAPKLVGSVLAPKSTSPPATSMERKTVPKSAASKPEDKSYENFMDELGGLGAFQ